MRHSKQLNAAQDRRGSMLIMVVVILVLLALIGTAMISTSRVDRVGTVQHSVNVQVDLLFESVKRLAVDSIRADLFGKSGATSYYKPAQGLGTGYRHLDYPLEDHYLASRSPEVLNLFAAATNAGGTNAPFWPSISFPLLGTSFENPTGIAFPLTLNKREYRFAPTTGTFNGKPWPHMNIFQVVPGTPVSYTLLATIPAADTDGDGIADAGMFRLPVGELNGVTYFAAVRIIDQGSTVNLSTAWRNNDDFVAGVGVVPGDFFPTNVDTERFLASNMANETTAINTYRNNPAVGGVSVVPVDDSGNNRTDFTYISPYDALFHQLVNRLSNPGLNTPGNKYQAFPETDDMSLAYPFAWYNQSLGTSTVGTYAQDSLVTNPRKSVYGSTAADVKLWFDNNFEFRTSLVAQANRMLRATSSVRNPVSNTAPVHAMTTLPAQYHAISDPLKMPDPQYPSGATPKACINTAPFNELWRAFWNIMADGPLSAPYGDDQRMFRSTLRDPTTQPAPPAPLKMLSFEVMMLRSALAALNAIDLRDNDFNVTSRLITIADTAGLTKYDAMVFGYEPQPFITEVYVNTSTEGGANPKGYVGIELYNPYPVEISLADWQMGIINRAADGPIASTDRFPNQRLLQITGFTGFPADSYVPAYGHVLIENLDTSDAATSATTRPGVTTQPTTRVAVANLHEVIATSQPSGGELVILKPRNAALNSGRITSTGLTTNVPAGYDENKALPDRLMELVPVDQFDFSGTSLNDSGPFEAINYVRESGTAHLFKQVYPGKYTISQQDRHEGTIRWTPTTTPSTQPGTTQPTMGQGDANSTYVNDIPAIQLHNVDWGGPNPYSAAVPNRFPFGGFARNIDMLEVPYIGAYRIRTAATAASTQPVFTEMNGVSMDSSFAEDMDATTDHHEMLGRFCPIFSAYDVNNSGNTTQPTTQPTTQQAGKPTTDWYAWTADFFDHLAVSTPSDDYFPHVEPNLYPPATQPGGPPVYAVKNGSTARADSRAAHAPGNDPTRWSEELLGNEGLINLNTAPWFVLARLPFVPPNYDRLALDMNPASATYGEITYVAGGNGVPDNIEIAVLITAWRDGGYLGYALPGGPFTSLFDLNKVVAPVASQANLNFQNGFGLFGPGGPHEADFLLDAFGDFTPFGAADDQIRWDFEERFLMINRISNLVTTRSDAFTVYVTLQGWRNLNGPGPAEMVVERKAAMLVNRTGVVKITDTPKVTNIPTN
jgi:hypothetical protein